MPAIKKILTNEEIERFLQGSDPQEYIIAVEPEYNTPTVNIIVNNAAWATRIRYSLPEIVKTLKAQPEFNQITKVRYVVASQLQTPTKSLPSPTKMSRANEQLWRNLINRLKNSDN